MVDTIGVGRCQAEEGVLPSLVSLEDPQVADKGSWEEFGEAMEQDFWLALK